MGAISRPSNCSRGDAVGLWKATCVRKCLGSWGPDLHSNTGEREREKKKKRKPARRPWTGAAHSFTQLYFTWALLGPGVGRSLSLKSFLLGSVRRFSSLSSPSIFFSLFPPNFSPSIPLHQPPPSHPSRLSRIHLLSRRRILTCYCFSCRLGRPEFTNGLPPADQCFILSCINYPSSRTESGSAGRNTKRPRSHIF